MNLGRPAMVSVSAIDTVPLPSEVDDDDSQLLQTSQPNGSLLSFFNHSVKLYEIAQEILLAFYSGGTHTKSDGLDPYFLREQSVFRLESRLRVWFAGIPSYLRFDDATTVAGQAQMLGEALFRRQSVVLYLRFVLVDSLSFSFSFQ